MRKITLILLSSLLATPAAYAARGDNGEGQGGGSRPLITPTLVQQPYTVYETQTQTIPRTVYENVNYSCPETRVIPASLSTECHSNANKEESFDDFASGCKIVPAREEIIPRTCTRVEAKTVYETKEVQVAVTKYKDVWTCPKQLPKIKTTTQNGKKITYCSS